jgi:hypothetical protein
MKKQKHLAKKLRMFSAFLSQKLIHLKPVKEAEISEGFYRHVVRPTKKLVKEMKSSAGMLYSDYHDQEFIEVIRRNVEVPDFLGIGEIETSFGSETDVVDGGEIREWDRPGETSPEAT